MGNEDIFEEFPNQPSIPPILHSYSSSLWLFISLSSQQRTNTLNPFLHFFPSANWIFPAKSILTFSLSLSHTYMCSYVHVPIEPDSVWREAFIFLSLSMLFNFKSSLDSSRAIHSAPGHTTTDALVFRFHKNVRTRDFISISCVIRNFFVSVLPDLIARFYRAKVE